jgi:5-enolpyruvylshikimate-3-phosphate synthase
VPEPLVPLSIDEFPVFFVAAALAEGETLVRGALELRVKESDRLAAMAQGLTVLGVENQLLDDGLWIRGGAALGGGVIESHGDHRIAMAFAVAGLAARKTIEIRDVANVATSFPGFLDIARSAGLQIEIA